MKHIFFRSALLICMFFFLTQNTYAQEWQLEEDGTEQKTNIVLLDTDETLIDDTVVYASILLIPFEPRMYLSDSEREIAKASGKAPEVNQRYFRFQVEQTLVNRIRQEYGVKSLYFDTAITAEEDLYTIYSNTSYSYQEPVLPVVKRSFMKFNKKQKPDPETIDPATASRYHTEGEKEYMSVQLKDFAMLNALNEKYGTQLFLFINQFEIKTNYNTCLDIANKIYQREVIWHYTLMDKNGNVILGNTAHAYIPSNTNKAHDIAFSCFPKIANEIVSSFPE